MGLDCVVNRIAARIRLGDSLEQAGTLEAQEIKPVARELFLDRQRRINPPPGWDIRTFLRFTEVRESVLLHGFSTRGISD